MVKKVQSSESSAQSKADAAAAKTRKGEDLTAITKGGKKATKATNEWKRCPATWCVSCEQDTHL